MSFGGMRPGGGGLRRRQERRPSGGWRIRCIGRLWNHKHRRKTVNESLSVLDTETEFRKFDMADTAIAAMADEYLPLKIAGLEDAAGYALVHKARMDVKAKRVAVEKTRKELKADALEYGRKVDAEAKRLTALLNPIESHLLAEEKAVDDEKERIKNEAKLKAEDEERARKEAEEAKRKAEQEAEDARLRAEREKLEAERRAMEAERSRIAAEQKATQDKIDAERRAIELDKARQEAAEKARVETEQRLAREAAANKTRLEAEEAARKRAEALRPDREKLLMVASCVGGIVVPDVSVEAQSAARKIETILVEAQDKIKTIVAAMIEA